MIADGRSLSVRLPDALVPPDATDAMRGLELDTTPVFGSARAKLERRFAAFLSSTALAKAIAATTAADAAPGERAGEANNVLEVELPLGVSRAPSTFTLSRLLLPSFFDGESAEAGDSELLELRPSRAPRGGDELGVAKLPPAAAAADDTVLSLTGAVGELELVADDEFEITGGAVGGG